MSIFPLVILCLTTSNLLSFMDLTFQAPMQYCSSQHRTLISTPDRLYFHHRHSHTWVPFLLWPSCFILSGAISNCSLLFSSSILDSFQPEGLIFFLPFHIVHGVFSVRILKRFTIPSSSGPHFVRTPHSSSILGGPARHGSWLYWVMQALSQWQYYNPRRVMEKLKGSQLESMDLSSTPIPGLYPHHTWSSGVMFIECLPLGQYCIWFYSETSHSFLPITEGIYVILVVKMHSKSISQVNLSKCEYVDVFCLYIQ